MADDTILGLDFDITAAKKSIDNLITHVKRAQAKFENIKIKFQVDQKNWQKVKESIEKKANALKAYQVKLTIAPPTKANIKQTTVATNEVLRDVELQPIATTLKAPTKANVNSLIPQINLLVSELKTSPIKLNFTFTKGELNKLISQVRQYFGVTKSNSLGLNLSVNRGRGKQTLQGLPEEFGAAGKAKDAFYKNVQAVFPQLEKYFMDLGIAAGFATNRLIQFFKQANKNLGGIKGTVKSLTKLSTLRVTEHNTGISNLFDKLQGIGNRFRLFAFDFYIFGQALFHGVINPLKTSINAFRLFEQNMKNAQVLSGATALEFSRIENSLQKFSTITRYSKTVLSELVDEFARAGVNVVVMESALKSVIDLSDAVGKAGATSAENIRESYNILTEAFFAFKEQYKGIAVDRAFEQIANNIAAAANASKADLGDFTYFMNQVSASAAQAGVGLDETLSIFATMKQVMGSGRMAASALNQAFVQLATFQNEKEFPQIVRRLEQIGLSAEDIKPSIVGLKKAIDNIWKINPSDNEIFKIFGTEGSRVPNLLKATGEEFDRINAQVTAYKNSLLDLNSVEKLAEATRQTANYSIEKMLANFENLKIEIGKAAALFLQDYEKGIQGLIRGLVEWVKTNKTLIQSLLTVTLSVGALSAAGYTLGIVIQVVTKIFSIWRLSTFALIKTTKTLIGLWSISKLVIVGYTKATLASAAANLGLAKSTVRAITNMILLGGVFTQAGRAAFIAATGFSVAQVAATGLAAAITATAIIAGIISIIRAFKTFNSELENGLGLVPSFTDQLNAQKYEYSDASNELKTYNSKLKEQIELEKELINLKNSATPLTPEQEDRKKELELKSTPTDVLKGELEIVRNRMEDIQLQIKHGTNKALEDILVSQLKDFKNTAELIRNILNEREGKFTNDIIQNAALKQVDIVGRLTALQKKSQNSELSSKEFEEYNNLLQQLNFLKEKFKDVSFVDTLKQENSNIESTITNIDALNKEVNKLLEDKKLIDNNGILNYNVPEMENLHGEELIKYLEQFNNISKIYNQLQENPLIQNLIPDIKNLDMFQGLKDLKEIDLSKFLEQGNDVKSLLDKLFNLDESQIDPKKLSKFLTLPNQQALNQVNNSIEDINKLIEDGTNKSLSESEKKIKDINTEFDNLINPLTENKELIDKAIAGIKEQIAAARDRKAPEDEIKGLLNQETGLLDKQAIIAKLLLALAGKKTDALVNQTEELKKQEQVLKDQLEIDNLKLKGKDQEADIKQANLNYDKELTDINKILDDPTSTKEQKKNAKERKAILDENNKLEIDAIKEKYEIEKQAYLDQIKINALSTDEQTKYNAEKLQIEAEYQKDMKELKKKTNLTLEERSKAEIDLLKIRNNKVGALNKEAIDDNRQNQLQFVDTFFDNKIKQIEERIDNINSRGGNPKLVETLQKQKEELIKQKDIWKKIIENGGKFDASMANAYNYMKAMRLEQQRIINAQYKAMDILLQLAKAQNAYNKHLQIYNALRAAGKDTSKIQPILNEDIARIAGYQGIYGAAARAANMPTDIPQFDTHNLLQVKLEKDKLAAEQFAKNFKAIIAQMTIDIGQSASDLGRTFFQNLTSWFDQILTAATTFSKLLSYILDPTKPKSPPITDVVSRGVDLIGAEFNRLTEIDLNKNLKASFSGLNLSSILPSSIPTREISNTRDLVTANKTINDNSSSTFNINNKIDEFELIRKIDITNRRKYTRVGL